MNVQETVAGFHLREKQDHYDYAAFFRHIAPKLGAALLGGLMNRALLPGGYCPFGAALMAAVPQPYAAAAAAGGVIGCLTDGGFLLSMEGLRHMSVVLAVGGIRWALGELRFVNTARFYPFFTALAGILLTNTVISGTAGSLVSYSTLFFLIEGVMAGLAAMLFSGAFDAMGGRRKGVKLSRQNIAALTVMLCTAAIPLCRLSVMFFSPGAALLHAVVLTVLFSRREVGGAVAGIAAGAVNALADFSLLQGAAIPIAALLAGYAAVYGRIFAVSVYLATCLVGTLTSGRVDYGFLTEAAFGGVAACLLPPEYAERLLSASGLDQGERSVYAAADNSAVIGRLRAAASALTGVSTVVERVSAGLDKRNSPPSEEIYHRAFSKVCADCPMKGQCRGERAGATQEEITALAAGLHQNGSVSGLEIAETVGRKCLHEEELAGELSRQYGYYLATCTAQSRIAEVRSVVSQQWGSVGVMLTELSEEIGAPDYEDEYSASLLASSLKSCGYAVLGVTCTAARSGRKSVNLTLREIGRVTLERDEIADYVGECLGGAFDEVQREACDNSEWHIRLVQRKNYHLVVAGAQHCHRGERLCGDAYEAFEDEEGNACVVVSDGMGSGGRAAVEGAMACGLFSRLLRGGFGCDSAVRIVNSALLIKSADESLSTLDCLRVNLYNGRTMFCKAGAAQSYHVREGVVNRVDLESLPLGILRETDLSRYALTAEEGDLFVMLSDGVPTDQSLWFESLLERYDGQEPEEFAAFLMQQAAQRRPAGEDDDITVIVGKMEANAE